MLPPGNPYATFEQQVEHGTLHVWEDENSDQVECLDCGHKDNKCNFQSHIVIKNTDSQEYIDQLLKTLRCPKCLNLIKRI